MIVRASWLVLATTMCTSVAGEGCARPRAQVGAPARGPLRVDAAAQEPSDGGKPVPAVVASHDSQNGPDAGPSFERVSRTDGGKEVWADDTGLLCGDSLDGEMNHRDAKRACDAMVVASDRTKGLKWRLPTQEEVVRIGLKRNGGNEFFRVLPDQEHWFWSSSLCGHGAWIFFGFGNGFNGVSCLDRTLEEHVRCVAKSARETR